MRDAGIVIVTYNSGAEIGRCLDAARGAAAEMVVVDNASTDNTTAEVERRGVRLIANPTNRGFAAAVNQGIRALAAEYVLLLNPDAVLRTGIDALVEYASKPRAAGAGGRLVDSQGRAQRGFNVRRFPTPAALACEALLINRIWPSNPVNWNYRCLDLDLQLPAEIDQPAGALLLVRRSVWQEVGGFDEGFCPIWFEDVDFALRCHRAGYAMWYTPEVVAEHTGGHSIRKIAVEKRQFCWYGSLLRYSALHFRPRHMRAVCLAVMAGSILRGVAGCIGEWSLKPIAVYSRVGRLAVRCIFAGKQAAGEVLLHP